MTFLAAEVGVELHERTPSVFYLEIAAPPFVQLGQDLHKNPLTLCTYYGESRDKRRNVQLCKIIHASNLLSRKIKY